jgi:hypothetical protein
MDAVQLAANLLVAGASETFIAEGDVVADIAAV